MGSAMGSALEWALALHRAPGQRHVLRQKPLPAGVDRLLGVAAGTMPDVLADAARSFGEPEARVREAARFYAREILFFPQADAYRVLGVEADAGAEQIKAHHRLLQHWLHPDRQHDEDDAVFAARVNTAWNHLRSPERRQAYDEALRLNRPPELFDSNDRLRSVRAWVADDAPAEGRWRHRLPVLVLTAACLLLALLVQRDLARRPEAWGNPAQADVVADDAMAISVPKPQATAGAELPATPAPRAHALPPAGQAFPPSRPIAVAAPATYAPAGTIPPPLGASVATPMAAVPTPVPEPTSMSPPVQAIPANVETPRLQASAMTPAEAPNFVRIQSAQQAGQQFLHYMGAPDRVPPPIWNSPAIQSSAEHLRKDLHGAGLARLSGPRWRIGNETAVLTSGYVVQGGQGDAGTLTADLVWREGHWLVTGLSMEHAR